MMLDDGMGNVQSQLYSLKAMGITSTEFTDLRNEFLNSPQTFTNNIMARYEPVQKAKSNILSSGDEIGIDLQPLMPFPMFVRVMKVEKTHNSFSMTFATLEGHSDAGYVNFSGIFDEKTGQMEINIFNETRENYGLGYPLNAGGMGQILQWEIVMQNIKEAIGKDDNGNYKTEETVKHIEEYKYDKFGVNGKGKLIDDRETEVINEEK